MEDMGDPAVILSKEAKPEGFVGANRGERIYGEALSGCFGAAH
jgi:hypothetical protein